MTTRLTHIFWTCFILTGILRYRQATFTQNYFTFLENRTMYGSVRLGGAWTASCLTSCVVECMVRYKGCYSVVYNEVSYLCIPGGPITYGMSPLSSVLGDKFYYTDYCNTSLGYRLFVYKSVVDCFYLSTTWANYTKARSKCTALGVRVMQAQTQDRYDLFKHISRDVIKWNTFLGLTDLITEGTFVWEDGEVVNDAWKTHIFYPGEPNDLDGTNDCTALGHWKNFQDIYDDVCNYSFYVCEAF